MTRILYLLTDEISSVLVRGQLGFLVEHGFDVTVAARRADPSWPPEPGKWDDGVRVEHVPFVREPSPVADVRALWATIRLVRRARPTIVNASTPKAGLLGMLAAWLCRVPVRVYVVRGFRFETAVGWRRRLFTSLERLAMRCANHVVFNSRSLLAVGEREGVLPPGRGEVIGVGSGNGIDVARFADDVLPTRAEARERFGLPADAAVIGFVGRFTRDKGIADLIGAFTTFWAPNTGPLTPDPPAQSPTREQMAPSGDHLFTRSVLEAGEGEGEGEGDWLLLVGQFEDGDPVPEATREVIESHERIVVVPWLAHTGVAYRAMDVLAFPSYREGLPNVPLEAQLCGVPVVGYEATGTVDAVAPGGVLVPVGGTAELAEQLAEQLRAQVLGSLNRSSSGRQDAAWVADHFRREVVWEGLAGRYRRWTASDDRDRDDDEWTGEQH